MSLTDFDQHLSILYAALGTPLGLVIRTPSPNRTRMDFEHAKLKDPSLAGLRVIISRTNPDGEVWIIKKEPKDDTVPVPTVPRSRTD